MWTTGTADEQDDTSRWANWASWTVSGTTRVSWYEAGKTNLDLLKQEIVSGSGTVYHAIYNVHYTQ